MNEQMLTGFVDEMKKIAQAQTMEEARELVDELGAGPQGIERVIPAAGTIGGTMCGAALMGALGRKGIPGLALRGLGGVLGGLGGLGIGGKAQQGLINRRRINAYEQLTGQEID